MNHEPEQAERTPIGWAFASLIARRWWILVQVIAFGVAAYCAVRAAQILNETSHAVFDNFDDAIGWLGAALVATLLVAWTPSAPATKPSEWPNQLLAWLRSNWVELVLVTALFAAGFFMRFFRFQDTLSPVDGLCCEEHINGGVAFRTVEGERPLLFPTERWASALGFMVFGENTLGLRFFFTALGGAELVVVYLILRQIVSTPSALFGLGLYAAAWWPSLANRHAFETGLFFALLFALLLVRGTKAKSAVMFVGVGALAALLSYEYEAFKVVPIVGVGFLFAAFGAALVFPLSSSLKAYPKRLIELTKAWWRSTLVFVMSCAIVLIPMIIGTRNGFDLFLTSVHRNENDRGGSLLADNWEEQVRWVTQLFVPFQDAKFRYDPPLDVGGEPLIDPLTAALGVLGLVAGIVFFYRGYRLFFVTWAVAVLAAGSLVLQNWLAWKFISVLPLLVVLAALLIDDVRTWVMGLFGHRANVVVSALLVAAVAYAFWWNADKLFNDAPSQLVAAGIYDGEGDQFYAYCDYMKSRGEDNHSLAFSQALPGLGFQNQIGAPEDLLRMWGDFIWICNTLEGTALPAAEEAWPVRDTPTGKTTLVLAYREPMDQAIRVLNRAIPGLGTPDFVSRGPNLGYTIAGWEFDDAASLERTGLWGEYAPPGSASPAVQRTDAVQALDWDAAGTPLPPPFNVRWRGVVRVEEGGTQAMEAVTDDPVRVLIDGSEVFSTLGGAVERNAIPLDPGWHAVEIELQKESPGGAIALEWINGGGVRAPLPADSLAPVSDWGGWLHERTLQTIEGGVRTTTHRLDFAPHRASIAVLKADAPDGPQSALVGNETYTSVWEPPEAGTYVFTMKNGQPSPTFSFDGQSVPLVPTQDGLGVEATVVASDGPHRLEIIQDIPADPNLPTVWSGFDVSLWRELDPQTTGLEGQQPTPGVRVRVPLEVRPY